MSRSRMDRADAAWLHMDTPNNLMIITGVMWFDAPVDWKRARGVIEHRLVEPYPKLRQRVVETPAGPVWEVDRDFDLALHLHHRALPQPGDQAALQQYVGELMSIPVDMAKPPWQMYLVDGYGSGSALVTRIHHCVADGISIARLVLSMTDHHPDEEPEPVEAPPSRRRGPLTQARRIGGELVSTGFELAFHPTKLLDLARIGASGTAALARLVGRPSDPRSVLKGELGKVKRAAWSRPMPLTDVKAIGKATGATVNDVLVSALAGGLRQYLIDRGDAPHDLTAVVPFNLRPLDRPVPRSLGNKFGLVFASLPVGEGDPLARLGETKRRMDGIKGSLDGPVSYLVLGAMGYTPVAAERLLVHLFGLKGSLVATNVPGPRHPIYFGGAKVAGVMSWVPQSGSVSLGVSIFSYNGDILVGVGGDAKRIPEPSALVHAFEGALAELAEAAGG